MFGAENRLFTHKLCDFYLMNLFLFIWSILEARAENPKNIPSLYKLKKKQLQKCLIIF